MKQRQGKLGKYKEGAKNEKMVDLIITLCVKCGQRLNYNIENSCPYCGSISITCENCGDVTFSFGE